jgi:hypothetical protein
MNEEVQKAIRVHRSIRPEFCNSPIILSHRAAKKTTSLPFCHMMMRSHIRWLFDIDYPTGIITVDDVKDDIYLAYEYGHENFTHVWEHPYHDHKLLERTISNGQLPWNIGTGAPGQPWPLSLAMQEARRLGYNIPEEYINNSLPSYGEDEAYYAARKLAYHYRHRSQDLPYQVVAICTNFFVPNRYGMKYAPYFIDLLWILVDRDLNFRLLAIEIDGEHHLDRKERDAARDEHLASLGYEIWRVENCWCRVDGWKVISEVLSKAGIIPNNYRHKYRLPGENRLQTIDSYYCARCRQPMVRFDDDWIKEVNDELIHRCCEEGYE